MEVVYLRFTWGNRSAAFPPALPQEGDTGTLVGMGPLLLSPEGMSPPQL